MTGSQKIPASSSIAASSESFAEPGHARCRKAFDVGVTVTCFAEDIRTVFAEPGCGTVRHGIRSRPVAGARHFAQAAFGWMFRFHEKTDCGEMRIVQQVITA